MNVDEWILKLTRRYAAAESILFRRKRFAEPDDVTAQLLNRDLTAEPDFGRLYVWSDGSAKRHSLYSKRFMPWACIECPKGNVYPLFFRPLQICMNCFGWVQNNFPKVKFSDPRITKKPKGPRWLPFAETENLEIEFFMDYNPGGNGSVGQILKFTRETGELTYAFESFAEFLGSIDASTDRHVEVFRLACKPKVTKPDSFLSPELHQAILMSDFAAFRRVLKESRALPFHPHSVFGWCCRLHRFALAEYLIDKLHFSSRHALYESIREGYGWGIDYLIRQRGCGVNRPFDDGKTPLMLAAWHGHEGIVRQLLLLGADKTRKDDSGWTAQQHAHFAGEVLDHLLE